jgi:hypothetical protein
MKRQEGRFPGSKSCFPKAQELKLWHVLRRGPAYDLSPDPFGGVYLGLELTELAPIRSFSGFFTLRAKRGNSTLNLDECCVIVVSHHVLPALGLLPGF